MAEIQPFRGWRYDIAQVGDLSEVTAPPYDVIDEEQQNELYKKHPCNVIRLILNRAEPGDEHNDDRYARAAEFARHWRDEDVLIREREEAIYVYHQAFEWEGTQYLRKGFLARLRLEEFGTGQVFPHEQTMAGPKADRLALIKACKLNLSAIFGLYPDPEARAQTPLEEAVNGEAGWEARDDLGVIHRMWAVTDHTIINQVRDGLKGQPIFIADGHHRYETALNYRNSLAEQGELTSDNPANFVMMMFVGMSDPGLAILPTHRLISGLPDLTAEDVSAALAGRFEIESMGTGPEGALQCWENLEMDGGQDVFGFGTAADGQWLFARLTDPALMDELVPDQSAEWRRLGVSLLHKLVLDHLIAKRYPTAEQSCKYVHLLDEVTAAQESGACQLACLVAPAGIEDVRTIASQLEKMPPKSTYFYPKLLSGLVFNPLD